MAQLLHAVCVHFHRAIQRFRSSSQSAILQGQDVSMPETTLWAIFEEQFTDSHLGSRTAICFQNETLTFAELKERCDLFAEALSSRFKAVRSRVFALLIPPSADRVVAILGLQKLGFAYLPLDVTLPPERVARMLRSADVVHVISESGQELNDFMKKVGAIYDEMELICLQDLLSGSIAKDAPTERVSTLSKSSNPLVCVLYTSGSTGTPKTVPIHTRNLLNRLVWQWRQMPFAPVDVALHKTSLLFIDSLSEILAPLLRGVPLVVLPTADVWRPERLLSAVERHRVSRLTLVPSHLAVLVQHLRSSGGTSRPDAVASVRVVVSSGEPLPACTARGFFRVFPRQAALWNLYGSTETTGDVTWYKMAAVEDVQEGDNGMVTVGTPLYNNSVMVMRDAASLCAPGEVGSVYAAGRNIVNGYLNDEQHASFTNNALFCEKEGYHKLYHTGDLGVILDGQLHLTGRSDTQVKVRGHRVDLHEVEAVVRQCTGIEDCVVLPYKDSQGYFVPVVFFLPSGEGCEAVNMREECEKRLPKYALPRFMEVKDYPRQPHTGKLDRQALLRGFHERITGPVSHADSSQESQILSLLARNLSLPVEAIDLSQSFFGNGGNSLSSLATIAELHSLGVQLSLSQFLEMTSLRELLQFGGPHACHVTPSTVEASYQTAMLSSVKDKEAAMNVLSRSFTQKNPLDVMAGTSFQEFRRLLQSMWPTVLADDLSIVVLNRQTGAVVGVAIVVELSHDLQLVFDSREVGAINEAVEEAARAQLLQEQGTRWVDAFLDAVDTSLPDAHALSVLEMLERSIIEVAQKRGYNGILAVNSHPVTMELTERHLGYKKVNSLHVKSFQFEGSFPFSDAEDSYYIHAVIKRFK